MTYFNQKYTAINGIRSPHQTIVEASKVADKQRADMSDVTGASPGASPPISEQVMRNGDVNGYHDGDGKVSLRVIVIGAGIGGCTAAIALRRQGHEVVVCAHLMIRQVTSKTNAMQFSCWSNQGFRKSLELQFIWLPMPMVYFDD